MRALWKTQQLGQLSHGDNQGDAGEVAAYDLIRNELDEAPDLQHAEDELEERRDECSETEQGNDTIGRHVALGGESGGKSRENGSGRRARGGDEATVAADNGGDDAQCRRAEYAGEGAGSCLIGSDGAIDEDAERDGGWQRDEHRGQPAPEIASAALRSAGGELHRCHCCLVSQTNPSGEGAASMMA